MANISDRYAIVGVGESDRSKESGKSVLRLAMEAARNALADAGMQASDVDCILSYQQPPDSCDGHTLATALGIRPNHYMEAIGGGSSTEMLIADAIGLIEAGICKTALIYRAMNGRSGYRVGGGETQHKIPNGPFMVPYGLCTPGEQYAMIAARHMYETGTTEEQLGSVPITFYQNAKNNPTAYMRDCTLTIEQYLELPYVVKPFRLHDFCLETDEAAAIIVTSMDRAKDCKSVPVSVTGIAARVTTPNTDPFANPSLTDVAGNYAAPLVFGMAGVGPSDMQVAAIYDCFSWVVLVQLEAYGFVKRGEAGAFVAEGNLGMGGRLPANTAGGQQAEGYTNGMNNVVELVRQLRHDYKGTVRQVEDCEIGFASGWNGPRSGSAMVLRRRES